MFCNKCGSEIKSGASFCTKCGNKIKHNFINSSVDNNAKSNVCEPFTKNVNLKYVVGIFCLITVFGAAYYFKDSFISKSSLSSVPNPNIKLEVVELPKDLSRFDSNKTGPIFDKEFENILNFKRKHMGNPVFVSTIKNVKVFDEPDGKQLAVLPEGTYCEVGDYKKCEDEDWLYLRLIQEKNDNDNFPKSAWLRRADVEIDMKNSAIYVCGKQHANRDYRHIYSIVPDENRNLVSRYNDYGDVFLDVASIKQVGNEFISFKVIDTNRKNFWFVYDIDTGMFSSEKEYERIRKMKKEYIDSGKDIQKVNYLKDSHGLYYWHNMIATPKVGDYDYLTELYPGYLVHTAFFNVLEGY